MSSEELNEKRPDEQPSAQPTAQLKSNGPVDGKLPQDEKPSANDGSQKQAEPQDEKPKEEKKGPAGGFDSTPLPREPPGYTVKITFHRATNLPMADVNTLASDPYILATIDTGLTPRHKEDPPLTLRTPTIRRNCDPEWNCEWIVANVPASGFKLKARIYDEDPADHDDRLGNAHIHVDSLSEDWQGIKEQGYKIMKRTGSKRAYFVRAIAACFSKAKHLNGNLYVSVECLGRTQDEEGGGRAYTIGPGFWYKHYSPMLGRLANVKDAQDDDDTNAAGQQEQKQRAQRYNFQANQIQLEGPVPSDLYHRYVEFKPFVKGMFTSTGPRGFLLSKALHHQHARVYNFSRTTEYGVFNHNDPTPTSEVTTKFLDLVHYDKGGRIFTYVITLDALWRFTETGKEFGVDLLSKHTMHSDVSIYIAFSGEFFIRRLKHPHRPNTSSSSAASSSPSSSSSPNPTHPPHDISGGPPKDDPPKDPAYYELVIDNDSGTYRPNAAKLPVLRQYLESRLPGLKIMTLDCQKDEKKMGEMKDEQRQRKKAEGNQVVYTQRRSGSISSSDEEDLDDVEAGLNGGAGAAAQQGGHAHGLGHGHSRREGGTRDVLGQVKRDASAREKGRIEHVKGMAGRGSRKVVRGKDGEVVKEIGEENAGSEQQTEAGAIAEEGQAPPK
ncbi:hypothetical protein EV356DRAFT_439148 [Viridothelium virens]|uniref:C2 domain-containing protein n=1 Tax=Viridothelium virens TaxID=1048519 RepID=A0A6A6HNQ8_VIRVR|nr:hypothetical protein EV356DRAFT_439148 [Viridothelium virens]